MRGLSMRRHIALIAGFVFAVASGAAQANDGEKTKPGNESPSLASLDRQADWRSQVLAELESLDQPSGGQSRERSDTAREDEKS